MKNKLFLAAVCSIGLCLVFACSLDFDASSTSAARSVGTNPADGEETGMDFPFDENEQEFFRNQNKSFSIMDEAMNPFRIESDRMDSGEISIESQLYCDSFAGVFLDENGNLNIAVVQGFVSEQTVISMNALRAAILNLPPFQLLAQTPQIIYSKSTIIRHGG